VSKTLKLTASCVLVACLARGAAAGPGGLLGLPSKGIKGFVRDGLGHTIGRVLILLTPAGASDVEVRTTFTDAQGRYLFENIPSGTYRLTALKDGYAATIASVSSWLDRGFDLVLAPAGSTPARPQNADWILSAPPRDLLREIGSSTRLKPADDGMSPPEGSGTGHEGRPSERISLAKAAAAASEFFRGVGGNVQQSFSEVEPSNGSPQPVAGGSGATTSLAFRGRIGRRGTWDLDGEREYESTELDGAGAAGRRATLEKLRATIGQDTGTDGHLSVKAWYDRDTYLFETSPTAPVPVPGDNRQRRAWGYDAGWDGTVGADASVQVDVRYSGGAYGSPGTGSGRRGDSVADRTLDDEDAPRTSVWKTSARVSKAVGSANSVDIGIKARLYSIGGAGEMFLTPSASEDPSLLSGIGREGYSVNVTAAESWTVSDPLALSFGFDASHGSSRSGRRLEAIVPQAGVTYTPDHRTTVRGLVSGVSARQYDPYSDPAGAGTIDQAVGYRLRIERSIGRKTRVILDAESHPFFYDFIGSNWGPGFGAPESRSLYLSDAAARVREAGVSLETVLLDDLRIAFGGGAGEVDGRLAASLTDGDLLRALTEGTLRFALARIESKLGRTGTTISVGLVTVDQRAAGPPEESIYGDRRVEVDLQQDLAFVHLGRTEWSVLVSYRSASPTESEGARTELSADSSRWNSLSRISGGVSVRF